MPLLDPFFSVTAYVDRTVASVNRQPTASVESVQEASRSFMADVVRPRGDTVGVLASETRASRGGLEGAGMFTGTTGTTA